MRHSFHLSLVGPLFAADYSQIELRVLAHMSQDEKLIEAFREGADIHTKTASDVYGVKLEDVTSEMRECSESCQLWHCLRYQ